NYNETATASFTVAVDTAIDKQVNPVRASIGELTTYTIRIDVNQGTTNAVSLTDVLPTGLSYVSHSITKGNLGMSFSNAAYATRLGTGQTVGFNFGDVVSPVDGDKSNDYILIELVVRVDNILSNQNNVVRSNGAPGGTDNSSLSMSYTTAAGVQTLNFDADAVAAGIQGRAFTITEPNLSVSKVALPTTQALGDVVTYTITVAHTAASSATAYLLTLTDVLPTGMVYVSGSASLPAMDVSVAGQTLNFSIASLTQAQGSLSFTYQARVANSAIVDSALNNTVVMNYASTPTATGTANSGRNGSSGAGPDSSTLNNYVASASAAVTPTGIGFLTPIKSVFTAIDVANNGQLDPGDTLEYTVVLRNDSSTTTAVNVVLADVIPVNTSYVSGSASLVSDIDNAAIGSVSYDSLNNKVLGTGFNMLPSSSADRSRRVRLSFRVTVNAGVAASTLISNTASVNSEQTPEKPSNTVVVQTGPLPGSNALYVGKSVARLVDAAPTAATNGAGDTMRYTFVLQNNGNTPLTAVALSDTIPAGLTPVPGSANPASGVISGQTINWASLANIPAGGSLIASVDVTINGPVGSPSQTYSNQAIARSNETGPVSSDGDGDVSNGAQPTLFLAYPVSPPAVASLSVQKRWTLFTDLAANGVVNPGDTIEYTLTVDNLSTVAASNVRLFDGLAPAAVFPAQLTYVSGSLTASQGAVVQESSSGFEINLGTVLAMSSATVKFRMSVNAGSGGQVAANQATATANNASTVNSDDNANVADGLNPTLTPIVDPVNNSAAGPGNLNKTLFGSSVSDTVNVPAAAVIGEVLTYRISVDVPAGTVRKLSLEDTLPAGLSYVAGSARLARIFDTGLSASLNPGGVNASASGNFVSLSDLNHLTITGQTIALLLGDVINSDNDANAESYVLELQARVDNIAGNQAGVVLSNRATSRWNNALNQPQALSPVTHDTTLQTATLVTGKDANIGTLLASGGTVRYTLVITHTAGANASRAYDVVVADVLPAVFTSASVVSVVASSSGSNGVQSPVCSFIGTTLNCSAVSIAPAASLSIIYDAVATAASISTAGVSTITNNANITWTSAPGAVGGERTGAGGVNDHSSSDNAVVQVGSIALDKTVAATPAVYAIGDEVAYSMRLSVPPGFITDMLLRDTLASGLVYVTGSLQLSVPSGVSLSPASPPADFTNTSNVLTYSLGTLINSNSSPALVVLQYRARVANVVGNQAGTVLANSARAEYTNPGTGSPGNTANVVRNITVGEPNLLLGKTITSSLANLDAGSTVNFRISLQNTGSTTAYEVVLNDVLPPQLAVLTVISGPSISPNPGALSSVPTISVNGGGTAFSSTAFDLQAGDTLVMDVSAVVQNNVSPAQSFKNTVTATASSQSGNNANERTGADGVGGALNDYALSADSPAITIKDSVAITKSFVPNTKTTYSIGEMVKYQIKVDLLEGMVNALTVVDTLPAGLTYLGSLVGVGTANITYTQAATATLSGQQISFDFGNLSNLADGNSSNDYLTIDIDARVDNVLANQNGVSLGNNAYLSYSNASNNTVRKDFDAIAGGAVDPLNLTVVEPNLLLQKVANQSSVSLGDEVTYSITVSHTAGSTADAYLLTLGDTLPNGMTYVSGSSSLPLSGQSGQSLSWTIPVLARTDPALLITYRARVSPGAIVASTLSNALGLTYASTATATGAANSGRDGSNGPGPSNTVLNHYAGTAVAPVLVNENNFLTPVKSRTLVVDNAVAGQVDAGDVLEYRVQVTNSSGTVTATNVWFADPIPSATTYVTGSVSSSSGVAVYNASQNRIELSLSSLAPSGSVTITFRVSVNAGTPAGTRISNQASVDSDQTTPTPSNLVEDVVGPALTNPNPLRLSKTVALLNDVVPTGSINAGDTMRYTLTLANQGNAALSNVVVSDVIPAGLVYVASSATASTGTVNVIAPNINWTVASLPVGGTAVMRFDVLISAFVGSSKQFDNQASAVSAQTPVAVASDGN
ncbi:MAG: hypothetical protein RLZZ502_1404, partial [Pseudomonadota bacterium]